MAIAGLATARMYIDPKPRSQSPNLSGKTVNVRDFCTADGLHSDSKTYQALIDSQPSTIIYPDNTTLILDAPIRLNSDQEHIFGSNVRIEADVEGFALSATGLTGQNLGALVQPIDRYSKSIILDRNPEINPGDVIILANLSNPNSINNDINIVDKVYANTITTRHPIGRDFPTEKFAIYHVYYVIKNLTLRGNLRIKNQNPLGGIIRFVYTSNIVIDGIDIEDSGYIGISFENSMNGRFDNINIKGAGASGLGFRSSKIISINNLTANGIRSDEALTFYDNVSIADVKNVNINQYNFKDRKKGESAGNNILIDMYCSHIKLDNVFCRGSSTYNFMINNNSNYCSISNFDLGDSNLGGIRISDFSKYNKIGSGKISDIIDISDQEAGKLVSGISIGESCTGTEISPSISFKGILTGKHIMRWSDTRRL
ncbi:hypothetical protein [Sphingomonas pseudosanguinis]|uniref:Right handed beta helix domain-containing protein n=1 Tax=Sphingomonas pseudosanguinis TaxID=413712 RepID=A0A7W6F3S5_9SPHN|nr:hypothetical protein [Sphingomonas pseudosanguinis]MBB3880137.1 hypothetical protein [Sphingomonas pseudosanguinis]MBN3538578.1 hypothetical protein [Sphingomonas pseudosanguinis]